MSPSTEPTWLLFALLTTLHSQTITTLTPLILSLLILLLTWTFTPGGPAWRNGRAQMGRVKIPGPRGLPFFGSLFTLSHGLPHRTLSHISSTLNPSAKQLMAFSLGSTPAVVTSDPIIAREILTSTHFSNRPIKLSAKQLMFDKAIGFAPNGLYWRLLRKISSAHLFSPKRVHAHEPTRVIESDTMLDNILKEQSTKGKVSLRRHLQMAALNNIMGSVFGKRYDVDDLSVSEETRELSDMVREGFELLGGFNWCDHLPWLNYFYDPCRVRERCSKLVPRVRRFVKGIIEEHKGRGSGKVLSDDCDFVDVLLSLEGDEKLDMDDMIAVLWEMIFRGTETTAILTEWVIAELILNPEIQSKLQTELNQILQTNNNNFTYSNLSKSTYLQAIITETLRLHPPGPLLSWARLSTSDVQLSNGMVVPTNTTAMVNMWAITHDSDIWTSDTLVFNPERFLKEGFDVRGSDLRLAPFGAGRRVCPGRNLGLVSVSLWVAKLVSRFEWVEDEVDRVDLSEVLKLSCEMKKPLSAVAVLRNN